MEQGRDHHQQSTIGKTGIQPIFAVFWRVAPLQNMEAGTQGSNSCLFRNNHPKSREGATEI